MYYYLESEFEWQNRKLNGGYSKLLNSPENEWNVFEALIAFGNSVLIEENGMPECQYKQLLRWRDMITSLEEDLFITSYLAFKDCTLGRVRHSFFWKPVIGHNNWALNRLVSKGVAENHFHLKGSAPQFHLSWLSLMNQVDSPEFEQVFETYEANRLQKNISYSTKYKSNRLSHMWRQAALIRVFLFSKIKGEPGLLFGDFGKSLYAYLGDEERLKSSACDIQENIDWMHDKYEICAGGQRNFNNNLDYMICEKWLIRGGKYDTNGPLSGERWFMYHMFYAVFSEDAALKPYFNLFYLYLVLKSNIRRELVQTNVNVGFDNFLNFQDRKDIFIENSIYESVYVRMAVRDTIYNQHIENLEARIMPKGSAEAIRNSIIKYDSWITKGLDGAGRDKLMDKYFYVIHFAKETERITGNEEYIEKCRHFALRRKTGRQALAISELMSWDCAEAKRIKGVDACSPEIWCRPEVFAQAFRYLKNYVPDEAFRERQGGAFRTLMATYHVGEDFLDVIDGLRAIDEAILFLNLRCGDRLGHALALGVDVEEWYRNKSYRILINKMGFIDNLCWLYAMLREYNISGCEDVKTYIEKRFDEYFVEIYKNNISSKEKEAIMKSACAYYKDEGLQHSYNDVELSVGINEYYDAWKLRGDNPALYKNGFFKLKGEVYDEWDNYAVNKEFPVNYKIRYRPEVAMLYHAYHFNPKVKLVGDEMIEIKINANMIKAVKMIQRKMQEYICRLGIGIETNPSSNYLIGTFRRYDKHPIIGWYNYGLTLDQKALEGCPQLQVSINTDDQGVFSTYIENEYAYLALALEKSKDETGKPLYNRTMILQWLDNIRRMGLDQSFRLG